MADARDDATPSPDHATHDPERIVVLLDEDASATDRALGEALVVACVECARLHDDLVALARATQSQPAPTRTRDFRLTPADAARLGGLAADAGPPGEPLATATRLSGDMPDPRTASAHATHDTMLVASLADHSIVPDDRAAADRLVAACRLCAALHEDLIAIRAATIQLPTPARPADYRLTEADAARLRRPGWRRWIAAFGSPRDGFSRPLAIGLTTLGIVGILVSGAPLLAQGSATSAAPTADQAAGGSNDGRAGAPLAAGPAKASGGTSEVAAAASAAASAAAPAAGQSSAPQPVALGPNATAAPQPATPPAFAADQGRQPAVAQASPGSGLTNPVDATAVQGHAPTEAASTVPPLVVLSGVLLLAGVGLFLLRWMARRFSA